jgi:hypothetical protein
MSGSPMTLSNKGIINRHEWSKESRPEVKNTIPATSASRTGTASAGKQYKNRHVK